MSDYTPVYVPGRVITLTASAAVNGGDLLVISGSGTVAKASAVGQTVVGVAEQDTPINGRVTVFARGIVHESVAIGTVTAGDSVGSSATSNAVATVPVSAVDLGAAYTQGPANTALNAGLNALRSVCGVALTTAANPAKVRWMEI